MRKTCSIASHYAYRMNSCQCPTHSELCYTHSMKLSNERLIEARQRAGFATAADAAKAFGWSEPTYHSHENGSRGIRSDVAERYARAFQVTPEWLLFGKGGEPKLERVENGAVVPDGLDLVPVYSISASAGSGTYVGAEESDHSLAFPPDYLKRIVGNKSTRQGLSIIGVKGESMWPTLNDDDIVMVDHSKTGLGFDGLFVVRLDGTLHVKRIGRSSVPGHVKIISDNPNADNIDMSVEMVEPVGKVIWYGRKV